MSLESLLSIESRVSSAIESRDSDFVLVDDDGWLVLKDSVPSGQMIKIREDQILNSAGGYVFSVSDETRIRRFLILGTAAGTFYATEKELTLDNVEALKDIIHRGKASLILKEILDISLAGRNPKQQPVMLALALCARYRVSEVGGKTAPKSSRLYTEYLKQMHKEALSLVNQVCRIPTHLFMFVKFCELVAGGTAKDGKGKSTGWGRLMRKVIQHWYVTKSPQLLAMHISKYGKREGWSHGDLLRLSHPEAPKGELQKVYNDIFYFALHGTLDRKRRAEEEKVEVEVKKGKKEGAKDSFSAEQLQAAEESQALVFLRAFSALNAEAAEGEVVNAICTHGFVREHVPTSHLNSRLVWKALLEKMPMTAMIRNVAKMQTLGLLQGEEQEKVISQLTDVAQLKASRIHPIQVLLAKSIYDQGKGDKGKLEWTPEAAVSDALECAFYASFVNVSPTGKRFCLAFDVSGSMGSRIVGTCISARQASVAIGLTLLKVEHTVECVGFSDNLIRLPYTGDWTLDGVSAHMDQLEFGSTDCALPMVWAQEEKKQFDVFIVFTDCETYYGNVHPFEALKNYRNSSGISSRLIVAGMTATDFTIADPQDSGMLDVVGFDSAVPEIIANFLEGRI